MLFAGATTWEDVAVVAILFVFYGFFVWHMTRGED
jgi:hypothetical protein